VQPCIDAIDAYYDEDYNKLIEMPEGVSYRGEKFAPASAIIEQHHLHAWLPEEEY
jgi:(2Fe-2S) ferredoxin